MKTKKHGKVVLMKTNLSTWLNERIKESGWSIREVARRANISHSWISNVLSGQKQPNWDFCVAIAPVFDVPVETLFHMAGLLPQEETISDISSDELDALNLVRRAKGKEPITTGIKLTEDIHAEVDTLCAEYPTFRPFFDEALEKLHEQAIRALVINVRTFIALIGEEEDNVSFREFHRQLSKLFTQVA